MQNDQHTGHGRILSVDGDEIAPVSYTYQIDRRHRVWKGTAERTDERVPLPSPAGPAILEISTGETGPIHYYHRMTPSGPVIAFTGRGAPPGE